MLLCAQFVVGAVVALVFLDGDADAASLSAVFVVAVAIAETVALGAVAWLLRAQLGTWRSVFGPARWRASDTALGVGVGLAGQIALNVIVWTAVQVLDLDEPDGSSQALLEEVPSIGAGALALVILVVVVVAPVVEELVFRRSLLTAIERRWRPVAAIAASSLLFGLVHIELFAAGAVGVVQVASITIFGAVLAVLYRSTAATAAPIAAHVSFNLLAVVSAFVAG
ncbi:MAG: CPBP family intramembrane metalloprotease [Actinobacteria bacterium]|nr:CPBP family intramembrane metalloprotease [Actinomycetota bacterium]